MSLSGEAAYFARSVFHSSFSSWRVRRNHGQNVIVQSRGRGERVRERVSVLEKQIHGVCGIAGMQGARIASRRLARL